MRAADVMTKTVITVPASACVQDVAGILLQNRISAVPVVSETGKLVGIVSEGDLMRRPESETEKHRSWWLELLMPRDALAAEFVKSHSRNVADVMTRKVVTAAPDTPLHEIANLLEKNRIKRVPVVEGGKIVGIISRANLLQGLAALRKEISIETAKSDSAIREQIISDLKSKPWVSTSLINVIIHDGVAELWGMVDSQSEKEAVRIVAELTPGVRAVNDNIAIRKYYYAGM
jgi:CBS domain-containing protein